METCEVLYPTAWRDHELLDSGEGHKLERFGSFVLSRPDPRALWMKHKSERWEKADAIYIRTSNKDGQWQIRSQTPHPWHIEYEDLKFVLRPTEFKHVGIFPEQAVNWEWLQAKVSGKPLKVLNLFAYTGGVTLACLKSGASVTHVDSVKSTVLWARENAALSNLEDKPVRWITDDAVKFVQREIRRNSRYDGIIMDPPRFGRGTRGEVWKLEEDLPRLVYACKKLLSLKPAFFLINAYTADISSLVLHHVLADITTDLGGTVSFGELALRETAGGRLLPNGIFARWSR